jgi:hypothetical protein
MENPQPSHQEGPPTQYPTGRGYGHDYMRGGEVFGGYGYSERDEYRGPAGAESEEDDEAPPPEVKRRPDAHAATAAHATPTRHDADGATAPSDEQHAPVPQLEHTFGLHWLGGHSRSFYVTQAQLQHRIYGPRSDSDSEPENPSPS